MAKQSAKAKKTNISAEAMRSFRATQDIENFYRFIHENDLRNEAKILLKNIVGSMKKKRKSRTLQ